MVETAVTTKVRQVEGEKKKKRTCPLCARDVSKREWRGAMELTKWLTEW